MKTVLVSGAGGYIGIPLCQSLLSAGYRVIGFDRFFFGRELIAPLLKEKGFSVTVGDTRYINSELLDGVDAVIDLAGLSNDASAEIDIKLTFEINTTGGIKLATAAKKAGVRRYIYSSSASVYGHGLRLALSESDECSPIAEYARSKVAVEQSLRELQSPNFEAVILRSATLFGLAPRMRFDLAINIMTLRALRERVIYIMGGGEQWRPFIHIRDAVRAFMLALESTAEKVAGQTFNVGSDGLNYKIENLAQFVQDVIPNVTLHIIPDNPDLRNYNVSFQKIKTILDFSAEVQIHEGIVEIKQALERGDLRGDDPRFYTLQWYASLMDWEKRLKELTYNGRLF